MSLGICMPLWTHHPTQHHKCIQPITSKHFLMLLLSCGRNAKHKISLGQFSFKCTIRYIITIQYNTVLWTILCLLLIPSVGIWWGDLREVIRARFSNEDRAIMTGLMPLQKWKRWDCFSLHHMKEKVSYENPGRGLSPGTESAGILILDFSDSEAVINKFLWFKCPVYDILLKQPELSKAQHPGGYLIFLVCVPIRLI